MVQDVVIVPGPANLLRDLEAPVDMGASLTAESGWCGRGTRAGAGTALRALFVGDRVTAPSIPRGRECMTVAFSAGISALGWGCLRRSPRFGFAKPAIEKFSYVVSAVFSRRSFPVGGDVFFTTRTVPPWAQVLAEPQTLLRHHS